MTALRRPRTWSGWAFHPVLWFIATLAAAILPALALTKIVPNDPSRVEKAPLPLVVLCGAVLGSWIGYPLLLRRARRRMWRLWYFFGLWGACGVAFAIKYPDLLDTLERGKQQRSITDMRTISDRIQWYLKKYPAGFNANDVGTVSHVVSTTLAPVDGWGNAYVVRVRGPHFLIRSYGKDGVCDNPSDHEAYLAGPTATFNDDIVLRDGKFERYPAGMPQ